VKILIRVAAGAIVFAGICAITQTGMSSVSERIREFFDLESMASKLEEMTDI
jgi:hypothetical protein